jgi:SAM-dependent methyltransferase
MELVQAPLGRVLDIGAGPAVLAERLLPCASEYWVADLSLSMVATGRRELAGSPSAWRLRYQVADVQQLPFQGRRFDTVLCIGVLQYVARPELALQELSRVARAGGQIIVSFPNRRSPLNTMHRAVVSSLRAGRRLLGRAGMPLAPRASRLTFREDIPNTTFAVRDMAALARQVGLEPDRVVYHSLHFPFSIPGLRGPLWAWDRAANGLLRAGYLRTWGREAIMRLACTK